MQFELTILGSNGAVPTLHRFPTSQILNYNGQLFMIDCGEGAQLQMLRYGIKRGKLDHIFISHLHGDHYYGLMGLITSFNLNAREHPLHIYAPPGLEEIVRLHLKHAHTQLRYELVFHHTQAEQQAVIHDSPLMHVRSFPLVHRIPTTGFLFEEKQGLRKILSEKLREYEVPHTEVAAIKNGADFVKPDGTVVPNHKLTTDPLEPRSYAFCSDTLFDIRTAEYVKDVQLLYHEATFMDVHAQRAQETFHSTASQAARVAQLAGVQQLLLGHFSARYDELQPLLEEARAVFPASHLAEEGKVYEIERQYVA